MYTRAALLIFALLLILGRPAAAEAQFFRVGVGIHSGPAIWYHQPWGYPYPYRPYPGWRYAESVAVRIDVEPNEAEVYVNGYLAGTVDDFDGVFQRLRLRPGEHDITIYLDGYRAIHERRYFNPNASVTIRRTMQPLAAGEAQEARPAPAAEPAADPSAAGMPPRQEARRLERQRSGTLALRVEPADAEIVVDGERHRLDAGKSVLSLPLTPGRHKVEIRRDGYQTYAEDVLIRADATLTVTVMLVPRR